MSDKKFDETEAMFTKTTKPKLTIDKIDKINSIGVVYDGTDQGKDALKIATFYAKKFNMPLRVIASDDYLENFKSLANLVRDKISAMTEYANNFTKENEVAIKIDSIVSEQTRKILEILTKGSEKKLSNTLIEELIEKQFDVLVCGAPLFRKEEEEIDFGYFLSTLLSEASIHSNFLIVSETKKDLGKTVLSFVSVDQQPSSIVALTRRSLSIANSENDIKLIGIIDEKIIETIARTELNEDQKDDDIDLIGVGDRLKTKMEDTLSSIEIVDEIDYKSFKFEVITGHTISNIKKKLEDENPKIVLVRSVSRLDENLDPVAEQITRTVLNTGYPVMLVWD